MAYKFKTLGESDIKVGEAVFLRLDLNVPIVDGEVRDDYRITRSLPTVEFLRKRGARTVIVSHIDSAETDSLAIVAKHLGTFIPLTFVPSLSKLGDSLKAIKEGEFVLLENIRRNSGEMENNEAFSKQLASYAKYYVNEAFSVSHRKHASIIGVPKFLPSFAGFLFEKEVMSLSKAFNPPRPFLFLLAGAKFETKFPLVKKFLKAADTIFLGGALANDLLRAKGFEIGLSKHSEKDFGFADIAKNGKLVLPIDVVTEDRGKRVGKVVGEVSTHDQIMDAGPKTVEFLAEKMKAAKFILWNGTLGVYERDFTEGTEALAKAIAESGVESIVGGGDTLAAISKLKSIDKFSFISTGGGAMLDFLANETLPGIEALKASRV